MKLAPDEDYWEIGNQWRRLMREIVYSRCSETRILATARILICCERRGDDDPYSLVLSSLSVSLTSYSTWRCIQRGSKQIAIWNLNISVSKLFGSRKYLNRDVCGAGTNDSSNPGFQTPGPRPWFFCLLSHAWHPAWGVDFASEFLLTKMPFLSSKIIL